MKRDEFWLEISKLMILEDTDCLYEYEGEMCLDFEAYLLSLPIVYEEWRPHPFLTNGSTSSHYKDVVVKTNDERFIRFSVFKNEDGKFNLDLSNKKAKYPQFVKKVEKTTVTYKGI